MQLNEKALEQLRIIINGDGTSDYRSGPKLVDFFNDLGGNDRYGQGFPSRWVFTDEKLKRINGTADMDKCLRKVFAVFNYVGHIQQLDALIAEFNEYMVFDKWQIVRDNDMITFKRLEKIVVDSPKTSATEMKEDEFLRQQINVDIDSLGIDANVSEIIKLRLKEAEGCISKDAPLASIFLIGSIMEGILLGTALLYPQLFNQSPSAPKEEENRVKKFPSWTLNNFIDVSSEIGLLKQDVKKFSHVVRDYRNYIHPYEQLRSQFSPDTHTAMICLQVLKAAISQIGAFRRNR